MAIKVLITGADGFVGRMLVKQLLESESLQISSLKLLDQHFKTIYTDARVTTFAGDFWQSPALESEIDMVFHLASIPGGAAERDFKLGNRVNLEGTLTLFEKLRQQHKAPVVVFASTIAVYGSPLPALVDANTPSNPNSSYGTQKLIGELMLTDFSRRGFLDARVVRLPGIVARPLEPSGLVSAFMSDAIRCLSAGELFISPVSSEAVMWWMSARCGAKNLIHAASLPVSSVMTNRVNLLPALHATMGEIVAGIADLYGTDRLEFIRYEPVESIEAGFGRFPPMDSSLAESLGFHHDGTITALIQNALELV